MLWKVFAAMVAVFLGAASQIEMDEEVLIATKTVALTANRAKIFQFLSDMRNYKRVSTVFANDGVVGIYEIIQLQFNGS